MILVHVPECSNAKSRRVTCRDAIEFLAHLAAEPLKSKNNSKKPQHYRRERGIPCGTLDVNNKIAVVKQVEILL